MYIPKRYGQSKIDKCPFCNQQATTKNKQDIPVCPRHKDSVMNELKCVCGSWLEMRNGKYGVYYSCLKCGNINMKKALEINQVEDCNRKGTPAHTEKKERIIETVTPDDPRYFD